MKYLVVTNELRREAAENIAPGSGPGAVQRQGQLARLALIDVVVGGRRTCRAAPCIDRKLSRRETAAAARTAKRQEQRELEPV